MLELSGRPGGGVPERLGWLCPTEQHRARMLDMGRRVRRARTIAAAAVGVGMLATIGALGWWAFALFAVTITNLATLEWRMDRTSRPERVVASSVVLIIVLTGVAAIMTGGATSPVLMLIVIPVAVTAARFRAQVVWAAAASAALVAILVATISGPEHAINHPLTLIAVLVLLVSMTATTTALADAELQFRGESVLDPLTGLLNRSGLEARFFEVGERARMLERPVCLIICDLDQFKRINDRHGHARGDMVLREISSEMRDSLRSFELLYRLGGDEFLILLPGIDLSAGLATAQSLRAAVEAHRSGGPLVTASFGVSAAIGEGIDFLPLYRAADAALYRAKSNGGNLVVAAEPSSVPGSEIGRARGHDVLVT
jgi:diguanylate cyclase (GGDEF)-like protein